MMVPEILQLVELYNKKRKKNVMNEHSSRLQRLSPSTPMSLQVEAVDLSAL